MSRTLSSDADFWTRAAKPVQLFGQPAEAAVESDEELDQDKKDTNASSESSTAMAVDDEDNPF